MAERPFPVLFYLPKEVRVVDSSEIAKAVQAGESGTLELWIAVRRLALKFAIRWEKALDGQSGMERDDFMQVAFLAMLDAVKSWNSQAGAFNTWFVIILKGAFTEAAGLRTAREMNDPLRSAQSLDAPVTDENGEEVEGSDIVPDPAAERPFEDVAELDFTEKRRNAVEAALASLPEHLQEAIRAKYYRGEKANNKDVNAALRALRHPLITNGLRPYLN